LRVQVGPVEYAYAQVINDIGRYMLLGLGTVWAWLNVFLSYKTRPLLSSQLVTWMHIILAHAITITLVVALLLPVSE